MLESYTFAEVIVDNKKKLLINLVLVLAVATIGATLMMGVHTGGTFWLKFLLYLIFFASISSPAIFAPNSSCTSMLRLRKRS